MRFSHNPTRQRGTHRRVAMARGPSLTRRVMKNPMPHAKTQLQNDGVSLKKPQAMPGAIMALPRWGAGQNPNERHNTKDSATQSYQAVDLLSRTALAAV
ncbi:MAG TPA: hypothetical protein DDX19_05090, partial [Rhodopirellula baltica]|nr:hypothetical protein [Rhodopirellula baltica]